METNRKPPPTNGSVVRSKEKRRWWMILFIVGLVLFMLVQLFRPRGIQALQSYPHPVQNYAEAFQQIEKLRSQESPDVNPVGRLRFMTHHHKVDRAIVFVHGYTNCPQQFTELGKRP